jgi:hypothetical protein
VRYSIKRKDKSAEYSRGLQKFHLVKIIYVQIISQFQKSTLLLSTKIYYYRKGKGDFLKTNHIIPEKYALF